MDLVVFFVSRAASHKYASMGLARRFSTMGIAVEYWGDGSSREAILQQGFQFQQIDGFWQRFEREIMMPRTLWAALRHPILLYQRIRIRQRWRKDLGDTLDRFERRLDELLLGRRPKLVIFDPFIFGYYPFFYARNIPGVLLSSKPLLTRDPLVPPYTSRLVPKNTLLGRQFVAVSWMGPRLTHLYYRSMRWLARQIGAYTFEDLIREGARRCGFPLHSERITRYIRYDLHFSSVKEWALWLPETDFPRAHSLPPNIRYIGPTLDLTRRSPELPLRKNPDAAYLLYISMGTSVGYQWKADVSLLRRMISAFQDLPDMEVFISAGDPRVREALGEAPANMTISEFLPQLKVLEIADLAITHAGSGTFRECIAKGVPMLAYPRNFDQMGNAARIVHLGIGLRGSRRWDSTAAIRQKALRILKEKEFRRNLERLQERIETSEMQLLSRALREVVPGIQCSPSNETMQKAAMQKSGE